MDQHTDTATEHVPGYGWLVFAGIMLAIVGFLNAFYGLALVAQDEIVVTGPEAEVVLVGSTTGWGWTLLVVGIIELFTGFGALARRQWARWLGIIVAGLGLVAQFPLAFGPNPLWSLTMVLLCAMVIYGLAVHGGPVDPARSPR
ncbi:MAG: hypothetical protein AAGK32_14760 [Actinomycetota bacterium]